MFDVVVFFLTDCEKNILNLRNWHENFKKKVNIPQHIIGLHTLKKLFQTPVSSFLLFNDFCGSQLIVTFGFNG